jgi:NADPH-dependent 2,4-dienoyl-CoA reductase/sulfur reductase-like enzyme
MRDLPIRDLIVIGAGPAGMAAAIGTAEAGLDVLVLDESEAPGGQIYRGVEASVSRPKAMAALGADYARGTELARAFHSCGADYQPGSTVWNVSRDRIVNYTGPDGSVEVAAHHVLIATGALERPVPVTGWTLPGVMTAGAVQILMKSPGIALSDVLLAGSGPLLWLVAQQLCAAGAPPVAVVETVPRSRYLAAAPELPRALRAASYLAKGMRMMRAVRAAGVPVFRGATRLAVEGSVRAEALRFDSGGRTHRLAARTVALHQGVIPNQQITRLIGAAHDWDDAQLCFRPRRDAWLRLDLEGFSVAGDGGGIGGALAAEAEGRIAALGIAEALGRLGAAQRDARAADALRNRARELALRPLLDRLYAPPDEVLLPPDEVTICRCEEVRAGALREAVALGCPGPNQAKSYLRCGMGPCQGRLCGPTVTTIIAAELGRPHDEIGYYRIRPPLKPLTLGELAALDAAEAATEAAG